MAQVLPLHYAEGDLGHERGLNVLARQRLRQRLHDRQSMANPVAAWVDRRNATVSTIDWRSTSVDARTNLRRLYPAFDG